VTFDLYILFNNIFTMEMKFTVEMFEDSFETYSDLNNRMS